MHLVLEQLETRVLLAVPIKPFDVDLLAAGDSGVNNDDITNLNNGTLELIAETDGTVAVYNAGYLGDATGQNDTLFYESGGTVVIEAEKGTFGDTMAISTAQIGYEGTGYIYSSENNRGTATYQFYITTADTYYVYARTYFSALNRNSFYVNIDDTWVTPETGPAIWDNTEDAWHISTAVANVDVAGPAYTWVLSAGWHTMELHGREKTTRLDRIIISNAAAPGNPGGAESTTYETFQYDFAAGDLIGSTYGTDNSITAKVTTGGGTSPLSDPLVITYDDDTITPAAPDLSAGSDTGDSSSDNLTNDTTATFTGTIGSVEPGSTVWLRVGAVNKQSTTANADGSYSVDLQVGDLAEGANVVDIYYIDVAGNTSTDSANLAVTLDTTANAPPVPPDLDAGSDTGTSNVDNLTSDTTATFNGGAGIVEADSTVWLRIGTVNTRSTIAAGDGSYTVTLQPGDLAEGVNAIDIIYIDQAGNTSSDSVNWNVTLDTTANPPAAAPDLNVGSDTGSNNADNITNDTTPTFTGAAASVEADTTVWLRVNGVNKRSAAAAGDGSYSVSLLVGDLSEGANIVDIIYIDDAGNTSTDSANLTVTLDTIMATPGAPDLRAASDTGNNTDNITSDDAAWFDGYAEPGATVQLFVGAVGEGTDTADAATGAWSIQLSNGDLAAGANNMTVQVTDAAGNTQTSPILVVTYDASGTAPNAPKLLASSDSGSSNADGITNINAGVVYGSVGGGNEVEAGATVHVRTNKNAAGWVEVGTTVADGSGNWSYTFDGVDDLEEGTNLVEIYITDLSSNDSANSVDLTITLDTTANAPGAAPDLDAVSDTGSSNVDNITSDTTATFTGTVEANTTVWLRIDGSNTRSTVSGGGGAYSITLLGGDLAEGANVVDIIYIDTAGNTSVDSANLVVTLDTSAAAPTAAPDLDAGSDTGDSNTDNLTNDTTATFTGVAGSVEGNSTVWLRVDTVDKRSTTANANGSYSVSLLVGDLAEGANTVDIYYIDPAGNTSTDSANLVVNLDTSAAAPALPDLADGSDTGISNSDEITSETRPTIQGIAGAVDDDSTVQIWLDTPSGPDTQIATTTATGTGAWSYTFTNASLLEEGDNEIHIVAVDQKGNASVPSADLTITLDVTANAPGAAPDLDAGSDTGSSNADNITSDTTATFTGTVEANSTVWLRIDGSNTRSAVSGGGGAYSVTLLVGDLAEGVNVVDIIYIDPAGNTSTDSANLTVTLDTSAAAPTAAPDLDAGSDTGESNTDNLTNDTTATFTGVAGSVEGGSTVWLRVDTVNKRSTTANANGSYSVSLLVGDLAEGANAVDIYYIDPAGNTSADSADLTVDLDTIIAAPGQPDLTDESDTGIDNADDITAETRPTIEGTVENDSTVQIWLDTPSGPDAQIGTTTAAADGSWSYTFTNASPLEEGVNQIHVVAVDPAGNISAASPDLTVTINFDTGSEAPPDLIAASDTGVNSDNITSDDTPTISGDCTAGATIKIRTNESAIINFTDNDGDDGDGAAGQWSYTFAGGVLNEGANTIDFLTIDTNNITSDWSIDLLIIIDTSVEQPTKPDLATADDSGSSSGDNITNETAPTISGTAEANSTVTININAGTHTDTAAVGANGIWSYNITNGWLNEGANTIFVSDTDIADNISVNSDNLIITLDTTINAPSTPDLTAATDTGNTTDNTTSHSNPRIVGTADPNTSITIRLDPNGAATVVGTTIADGAGNWSYTFAAGVLGEGANDIDVLSTDIAGNSNDSAELTITIETLISVPDSLDLLDACDLGDANNDDITSLETATISGTADANCTIYVRVNGTVVGNTASDGGGNWTYTFDGVDDLIEGTNIIDACAEDNSSNLSDYSTDLIVTLDTTTDTPTAPNLNVASDSGSSDSDNYTNIAAATIDGACEKNATVIISLNGNDNFDTVTDANGDGQWSYTFVAGLNGSAGGTNNIIKVAQRDVAGNLSGYGNTLTVTLDDTAGAPSAPDLNAGSDSGDADDDNLTNIPNVTISGTVEVNSSLQIFVNQGGGPNLIDTISEHLLSSGTWNYTMSTGQLAQGANQITVVATDKAGNVSASSPSLTITFDTTIAQPGLPDLADASDTGASNNDDITSDETPTFSGTADPNTHISIRVDGEPVDTVEADGAGNWSYTFVQGEIQTGVRQVDVVATDTAGNVSQPSEDLTIWLNVEPTQPASPNLRSASDSGSINTDNQTNIRNVVCDGKTDANCTVNVYVDANLVGTATSDNNGFWQHTFATDDLSEGNNEITIITEDTSGTRSVSSYALTIVLDTTSPIAPLPDLQSGSDTGVSDHDNLTSDETATIQGTTEPAALLDLYHNNLFLTRLTAANSGNWSYTFSPGVLIEGANEIYTIITDLAGNVSVASPVLTVTLDLQQDDPVVPAISPETDSGSSQSDGLTNNITPDIFGTVKPNSSVEILVSGDSIAEVQSDDEGAWQYTFEDGQLHEGLNHIEVVSTDPVGKIARSATLKLTIDTTPPVIYNYFPMGTYTQTTRIVELYIHGGDLDSLAAANTSGHLLLGSGGDGTFEDGNEWTIPITSVTVDSVSGLVQLNTAVILTDDTYQLTIDPGISLHDKAGNWALQNIGADQYPGGSLETQPLIFIFEIDTAGPPAPQSPQIDSNSDSGADDSDNITNNANPLVHVTADPEISVEVIINGLSAGFANETQSGQYQLYIDSSLVRKGENLLLARAFDGLGNSSELSEIYTFVYDNQSPEVAAIVTDSLWLNYGPTHIDIVFSENDIDPDSVVSLDSYVLTAAGGDGTFDDGNETIIAITAAAYNNSTQKVILTMPQTVTGASKLGPDTYRLSVLSDGVIGDIAGNDLVTSATQDFVVVAAKVIHYNQSYRFVTAQQQTITVSLDGLGDAMILLGESVGSDNIIEQIILNNTDENSVLYIKTNNKQIPITVGAILADSPLKSVIAPHVEITDRINFQHSLNKLLLGAIDDNVQINLVSSEPQRPLIDCGLQILFGEIGQNVDIDITGYLWRFQAESFAGGTLSADSAGSVDITKGDLAAAIEITNGDLDKLIVRRGNLTGSVEVEDQIGKIKINRGSIEADITAAEINSIRTGQLTSMTIRAQENISRIQAQNGSGITISAGANIDYVKFTRNLTDSTISAGGNLNRVYISADAIDNMILAGVDLGPDGRLDGLEDTFAGGNIELLKVKGSYSGTITAAAVNPGGDLTYFTLDDSSGFEGSISKIKFGRTSLENITSQRTFGLLASTAINPFSINGQLLESPVEMEMFRMLTIGSL